MTDYRNGYSLDDDLMPIMKGKIELPNFKELGLKEAVANIAAAGGSLGMPDVMNAKVPSSQSSWGHWARYFLNRSQGGSFDGTGYVIWYDHGEGRAGTFAICEHKLVELPGANHMRGWHPTKCEKCGMDLSVDSGD